MLDQRFRIRLAELNRYRLRRSPSPRTAPNPPAPPPGHLARTRLPAGRNVENESGRHWLIETPLESIWRGGAKILASLSRDRSAAASSHRELAALADHLPHSTLFLDLETCGFAGAAVFLIGAIHHQAGRPVLSQLLARDYSEEKAILHSLRDLAVPQRVLVSFNGKTFDWPAIQDRSILHRLDHSAAGGWIHCDLLHHARRKWKERVPDCRLQTLEQHICGRRRTSDIPGRDVPQAYHQFVRTGDATQLHQILHHNALDLITLVQLAAILISDP